MIHVIYICFVLKKCTWPIQWESERWCEKELRSLHGLNDGLDDDTELILL